MTWMKRLSIILIAGAAIELSRGYFTPRLEALPIAADGWSRESQTAFDPVPPEIGLWPETSHAVKAWKATYRGVAPATLTLFALPWSPGSAWDAIQRWRPAPGTRAFAKGRYFGVVESPGADQETLKRFIDNVLTGLPAGAETVR
jgi:hypothetical protein